MEFPLLLVLGLLIGAVGTVVGAGGGFLVVPLLLFLSDLSPQMIAGTSLTVTFFTSLSGSMAYMRQGRIDYLVSKLFILTSIPAVFVGVELNQRISAEQFSKVLGFILIIVSILLIKRVYLAIPHLIPNPIHHDRSVTDSKGIKFDYHVSMRRGGLISFITAVIAPVVGIGGGVLKVPGMVVLMGMPARVAAPTSQLVTLATSLIAAAMFALKSQIAVDYAIALAFGVVVGAQAGAVFSQRYGLTVRKVIGFVLSAVGFWLILV